MEQCPPQVQTPKRKRGQSGVSSSCKPLTLSLNPVDARPLNGTGSGDEAPTSPRSAITHRLGGLMLEGGAGAAAEDADKDVDMDAESTPKRRKQDHHAMQHALMPPPPPPQAQTQAQMQVQVPHQQQQQQQQQPGSEPHSGPSPKDDSIPLAQEPVIQKVPLPPRTDVEETSTTMVRPAEIKEAKDANSETRKRAGTPLLPSKKHRSTGGLSQGQLEADDDDEPVDPVRAALTWHDDEITVYDPNDEDDDGTGVNGIGFKPSPALAHSRIMKRRQQLAEYRRREDNDARAKRSQRRRGEVALAKRDNKSPPRRVRFMDLDSMDLAVKTG